MTAHVLLQTALLLLGLLFLVPGRPSQGCPGTAGTYVKMPSLSRTDASTFIH